MAWTTPINVAVGSVGKSADWNTYLGTAGNLAYLKVEADKLNLASQGDVTASRTLGTTYQNTSGKIIFGSITFNCANNDTYVRVFSSSTSAFTQWVGEIYAPIGALYAALPLIIPNNYYYKASAPGGGVTIDTWMEWSLH